jgi:hypothetical protein
MTTAPEIGRGAKVVCGAVNLLRAEKYELAEAITQQHS